MFVAGAGALILVAALAIPAVAQPVWGGFAECPGSFVQGSPPRGPVTIDTAVSRVKEVLAASGDTDLVPAEVMEFTNHFYVLVKEKSTGIGAMELIVERNGFVHSEPGPNMMWNTKYGHMAWNGMMGPGMMGPGWGAPGVLPGAAQAAPSITKDRARQIAAQYLQSAFPGAKPGDGAAFHGYFTFHTERDGKTFGMLSVNAYTGQVWYHSWHGTFVREKHL
ncbi:MAG: hypothetical protein QN187_03440 [Armatimonadota bacterium]|nr:hypothetical protein [Armatimonadota bacterium]MDR7519965.1 hypothetical protein [Armatimonadota bacterium]MDR7548586.1 hypothetical protein [Armatimonadota bacterium]